MEEEAGLPGATLLVWGGQMGLTVSSEVIQKFFSTTEEKHSMTNDDKYDSPPLLTIFGSPGFIAQ